MNSAYAIVGAGPSGLGCATALADDGLTIVVDRIPVTGGYAGWNDSTVTAATAELMSRGTKLRLGQTALSWSGSVLLVTGPGITETIPARHLFVAAGLRPATSSDLQIHGDRPAGALPATVAEHLLNAGVRLWDNAAIIGDGPWAAQVAARCRDLGTGVIAVIRAAHRSAPEPNWADLTIDGADDLRLVGGARISGLQYSGADGAQHQLSCDAVILADDPRPNRNIEGALSVDDPHVTFIQPSSPRTALERFNAGQAAAAAWLATDGSIS